MGGPSPSSTPPPIFTLSLELRRAIYRHLFAELSETDLNLCICCSTTATFSDPPVQILATRRQIYNEALLVLLESLAETKLIFGLANGHNIEHDESTPLTSFFEKHGGIFKEIGWDVNLPDQLPAVVDAFPNLERVTLMCADSVMLEEVHDVNDQIIVDYYVNLSKDDKVWTQCLQEQRYQYDPQDSAEWTKFLRSGRRGPRRFKLELLWEAFWYCNRSVVSLSRDLLRGQAYN